MDWLLDGTRESFSVVAVDPSEIEDSTVSHSASVTVEGLNYAAGNSVYLDGYLMELSGVDLNGNLEMRIPAGLAAGIYDLTVKTPDAQTAVLENAFEVTGLTRVNEWSLY